MCIRFCLIIPSDIFSYYYRSIFSISPKGAGSSNITLHSSQKSHTFHAFNPSFSSLSFEDNWQGLNKIFFIQIWHLEKSKTILLDTYIFRKVLSILYDLSPMRIRYWWAIPLTYMKYVSSNETVHWGISRYFPNFY